MRVVLDACTLIAYLRNEECAPKAASFIEDSANALVMHAINLSEVYRIFAKDSGIPVADGMLEDVHEIGIEIFRTVGDDLVRVSGYLKAKYDTPLADSYAAATAKILGGTLVTKDLKDFSLLADGGECRVEFII